MRVDDYVVGATGLSFAATLNDATRLARHEHEVHEASLVLVPLVRRFRATRDSLQTAIDDKRPLTMPHEKLVEQFAVEIEKLIRLVKKQKNATLATRVVDAERLAAEIQALHGGMGDNGTCTSGLSHIHSSIGEQDDEAWRRDVDTAISDYKQALREAVDTCLPDMERDPAMVREALILLEHEKKRGLLSTLGEHLWGRIRTLAPADVIEVPAWFISESDIVFTSRVFDRGGFATIHHATWDGSTVVTKVLRDADMATFAREVEIGFKLSHPHVVKIYGACHTSEPPFIVCEFAKNGNMGNYLVSHPDEKWRLLYEAALGLRFLHRNKIVHGDLKLNNILVMEDGKAKIADFGLSRRKETSKATTLADNTSTGAIRWRAPECFKTKPTFQSDVYSFGMCMYEAVSGKVPYEDIDSLGSVEKLIREGELPTWPADEERNTARQLFAGLTRLDESRRIDLDNAIKVLKELAEMHPEEDQMTDSTVDLQFVDSSIPTESSFDDTSSEVSTQKSIRDYGSQSNGPSNENLLQQLAQSMMTGSDDYKLQVVQYLRGLIQGSSDMWDSLTKAGAIESLIQLLATGSEGTKYEAVMCLHHVIDNSPVRSKVAAQVAGVDHLVRVLRSGTNEEVAQAASILGNLAKCSPDLSGIIKDAGGIETLALALDTGAAEAKSLSVSALRQLVAYSPEQTSTITVSAATISSLVRLLGSGSEQDKVEVCVALRSLAGHTQENCALIAECGGIEALVRDIATGTFGDGGTSVCALSSLAEDSLERIAMMVDAGVIDPLLRLVREGSDITRIFSAGLIATIAGSSSANAKRILDSGGVDSLVQVKDTGSTLSQHSVDLALSNLERNTTESRSDTLAPATRKRIGEVSRGGPSMKREKRGGSYVQNDFNHESTN